MMEDDILKGAGYEQMMLWHARLGLRRWKGLRPAGNARHEERRLPHRHLARRTYRCSNDIPASKKRGSRYADNGSFTKPRCRHNSARRTPATGRLDDSPRRIKHAAREHTNHTRAAQRGYCCGLRRDPWRCSREPTGQSLTARQLYDNEVALRRTLPIKRAMRWL